MSRRTLLSQPAQAYYEVTAFAAVKGEKLRGFERAVHRCGIPVVRDVVEAATQGEASLSKVETPLGVQIQVEVIGEAIGVGSADQISVLVLHGEREPAAHFQQITNCPVLP